jgi:threonine 3-dehydrogenase
VGARHVEITDVNDYRLDLARKLGIEHAINVSKTDLKSVQKTLGMTEGFDVGLEMSGSAPAFRDMIENMDHGGKIALLGILPNDAQIPWDQVIFKGLFLKGIYGREMYETWYKMGSLLQSGLEIENVITHQFPYTEFQKAFEIMLSGKSGKVILNWS